MDRVGLAKSRVDEFKAFAVKAKEAGPPCMDCRFQTVLGRCSNPAYAEQSFDPARGVYSETFSTPISSARSDDGLCGPEALLFEPRGFIAFVTRNLGRGAWNGVLLVTAVIFVLGLLVSL